MQINLNWRWIWWFCWICHKNSWFNWNDKIYPLNACSDIYFYIEYKMGDDEINTAYSMILNDDCDLLSIKVFLDNYNKENNNFWVITIIKGVNSYYIYDNNNNVIYRGFVENNNQIIIKKIRKNIIITILKIVQKFWYV